MRPSTTYGGRASHAVNPQANAAATKSQLLEKKKEYDAVQALERVSADYLARIQGLAEDFDVMADTGHSCGQVLAQWPEMFKILNMFLASREEKNPESEPESNLTSAVNGQKVVRLPIEELEQHINSSHK